MTTLSPSVEVAGLTNLYISDLLKNNLKVKNFRDVYSADTVPKTLLHHKNEDMLTCIVNLSKASDFGSHFVALTVGSKSITVHDSLSLPLDIISPFFYKCLSKTKKKLEYSIDFPIQQLDSSFCGFYCIYFVLMDAKKQFSNTNNIKPFIPRPVKRNDHIVIRNIINLIKNNVGK